MGEQGKDCLFKSPLNGDTDIILLPKKDIQITAEKQVL